MKYFFIIIFLFGTKLNAQTSLTFDKRFVESEDKWVAFKQDKDSSYAYGFIYIDEQAGLTLNYEGNFKIISGKFVPKKLESANMKVRLEPNNVLVAFIPENRFQELEISEVPEWLKYYKNDTNSVERLYRWGFLYNGWNECAKALTYLEKAERLNPNFKGLAVELAFSYNCLKQYDKAELILVKEIKSNPTDAYVNKEYIYTLIRNSKIDKAVNQFETSIKTLKENEYAAENCFNIMGYYYTQKDKENFNKWYNKLQTLPNGNSMLTNYSDSMKTDINK